MLYFWYIIILLATILLYFRLADRFNIIDEPNHRSSHKLLTIRGGGIIFPIAILLNVLFTGLSYPYFTLGLVFISILSFYDDIRPLSSVFRLFGHLTAVSLLFFDTNLMGQSTWIILVSYVLVIGTINAYNFMDGINGIIVINSLVTILTLCIINQFIIKFILIDWLIVIGLGLLIFGFFNFRSKAKCFAGDVGSVSMAFILIFVILLLTLKSQEIKYVGLFLVYGLDTVTTIIFRIVRGENIFIAHRTHFYQFLVNSKLWPHTRVSVIYGILQLIINVFILTVQFNVTSFLLLLLVSGCGVIALRFQVEGEEVLIHRNL